jgi:Fur family ferric uptake transcriptional regulator
MIKEKINRILLSAKLKRTEPRKTILRVLLKAEGPKSAEEILSTIGQSGPNKVTVYRTLESMAEAGIVHRAFIEGRSQYYETGDKCTEQQCHPHFVCIECGRTICLPEASVPMTTYAPAGFVIHRQQTRLEGLCPKCRPD